MSRRHPLPLIGVVIVLILGLGIAHLLVNTMSTPTAGATRPDEPHAGHVPVNPAATRTPSPTATATPDSTATAPAIEPAEDAALSGEETGLLEAADTAPRASSRELGETRAAIQPADVLESTGSVGGCLAEYGSTGQCVPAVPPSQARHVQAMVEAGEDPAAMSHPWTCTELITYFADGVVVRSTDVQGLDRDGDGVACGPGD